MIRSLRTLCLLMIALGLLRSIMREVLQEDEAGFACSVADVLSIAVVALFLVKEIGGWI